jgi:DNA-binding IclR family transcriptional regulator
VRRRGYAVGSQRALDRVDCAAAPVRVAEGPATAALALCAPRDRFQVRREEYARARSPAPANGSLGPFGDSERAWAWPPTGGILDP